MAFLDNSGDIILDAVLTDTGRQRLSKGDGSFRIAKFAFGDDEIDYGLFNGNTGSAYQDLEILQTPILEAFTNNDSLMKSTLLSLSDENTLYLPVIKLNELTDDTTRNSNGLFTVSVNKETEDKFQDSDKVMSGYSANLLRFIRADQGIDNANFPATRPLPSELIETQFLITIDHRFGTIISPTSTSEATLSYVDDDNLANYYVVYGSDIVSSITDTNPASTTETIKGSRGNKAQFRIMATLDLVGGAYFDDLGGTVTMNDVGGTATSTYKYIDTNVQIKGLTTGYRIDIPIRFVKLSAD